MQDLLLAANDQPFRFPATFTFVVRSFTVLDGIGKSLDARFDISEISAPYARNLLLEGQPQVRERNKQRQGGRGTGKEGEEGKRQGQRRQGLMMCWTSPPL